MKNWFYHIQAHEAQNNNFDPVGVRDAVISHPERRQRKASGS
jgi:hypothetical protein